MIRLGSAWGLAGMVWGAVLGGSWGRAGLGGERSLDLREATMLLLVKC